VRRLRKNQVNTSPNPALPAAAPATPDPGPHWKLRYWSIFFGQALSLIGSAMTQFVLLWWITDSTGSVAMLATAGILALLPFALLSPLGGVLADRYNRRLLMIAADLIGALCMALLIVLFLTERIEIWHVFVMVFIRSSLQAIQYPAAIASLPNLVPVHFLPRAVGLNQSLTGIMTVAAAPLGAFAISVLPIGWALSIDVFSAALGIIPLLIFRIAQPLRPTRREHGFFDTLRRDFVQGFRVVWAVPGLRKLYALLALVVMVVMPSFTLVMLLVRNHFGGGAAEVALMEGLAGAAMIAAGLLVAAIAPRRHIRWVIGGFALSCFALAATALPAPDYFWLAVLAWTLSGFFYILGNAPLSTLLLSTIPNHLQGRALSLMTTVVALAAPVGLALAVPVGELMGIRSLFILMGVVGGCLVLLGLFSKDIRRLDVARSPRSRKPQRVVPAGSAGTGAGGSKPD